jgi:glycosyltransferase involved in cell wall biosynthesis
MEKTRGEMLDAGIETLGRLALADVANLYQRGALLAYPTDFVEIDPISVKKAQACGCVPVTTDVGGLADGVQFGIKVPCKAPDPPLQPGRFYYGAEDPETQRLWVDAIIDLLKNPRKRLELAEEGRIWARQFSWPQIAARWNDLLLA